MMEHTVYDPTKKIINGMILLLVFMALPAVAHAASGGTGGLFEFFTSGGSLSCMGASGGQSCTMDEKKLFTSIACKVMTTVDTAIVPIFCNIINNPSYQMFLDGSMTLYVVIFGFNYLAGIGRTNLGTVIVAVIKVSLIYSLMTNADFFFSFVYTTILSTPQDLVMTILNVHGSGSASIFEHVDEGMYKIFEEVTQPQLSPDDRQTFAAKEMAIVVLALGLKSMIPGGNSVYGLFMFVVMGWLTAYLSIVVRYLLAYMAIVFLLMLSPFFIPSLLFQRTRYLFDEWSKMMFSFMIELVVVVAFVLMIEQFFMEFYEMLKKSFGSGGGAGAASGAGGGTGNGLSLTEGDTRYIRTYNAGVDQDYVKEETVKGYKNVAQDMNKAGFTGNATQISAAAMVDLVTMAVIVFLSSVFLRYIPQFAGMLAGQFNYTKMFGGQSFGQKSSTAGRADLFGQSGFRGRQSSVTPDADRPGGLWGDFTQSNPLN